MIYFKYWAAYFLNVRIIYFIELVILLAHRRFNLTVLFIQYATISCRWWWWVAHLLQGYCSSMERSPMYEIVPPGLHPYMTLQEQAIWRRSGSLSSSTLIPKRPIITIADLSTWHSWMDIRRLLIFFWASDGFFRLFIYVSNLLTTKACYRHRQSFFIFPWHLHYGFIRQRLGVLLCDYFRLMCYFDNRLNLNVFHFNVIFK